MGLFGKRAKVWDAYRNRKDGSTVMAMKFDGGYGSTRDANKRMMTQGVYPRRVAGLDRKRALKWVLPTGRPITLLPGEWLVWSDALGFFFPVSDRIFSNTFEKLP
jgi:hypothetical protein